MGQGNKTMPNPQALKTLENPWRERSLCRDFDPKYFHPPSGPGRPGPDLRHIFPKSICQECPVRRDCLLDSKGAPGIWGGLDETERWQILGRSWVQHASPPTPHELERFEKYWETAA